MSFPTFIVADLETGGLDSEVAQITEVGMVACRRDNLKVVGTYHSYIKPYGGLEIDPVALQKSGVSMTDVMSGQDAKVVTKEMIAFAKEHTVRGFQGKPIIVGHNIVGFDRLFAEKLFTLHTKNLYDSFSRELIDTLPLSRLIWGATKDDVTSYKLEVVCKRADIKVPNAHSALNDARANHKLLQYFARLMRGNLDNVKQDISTKEETHPHRPFKM